MANSKFPLVAAESILDLEHRILKGFKGVYPQLIGNNIGRAPVISLFSKEFLQLTTLKWPNLIDDAFL
jgi:hypothetical protein